LKALQPGTTLGDLAYSSATANTNTRLGIGTTNQVLSVVGGVPAWATAAAGGMTSIASGSFTGVASVTISSIPATYKNLQLVIQDLDFVSDNRAILIKPNNSGAGNYSGVALGNENGAAFTSTTSTDSITTNKLYSSTNTENLTVLTIYDYANSVTYKVWQMLASFISYGSNPNFENDSGNFLSTTTISSLVFASSGGNFAGTYTLYGVS
jgi:hypothetical protein